MTKEAVRVNNSLAKISKVCRFLNILMKVLFVVFCVGWLFAIGFLTLSLINPQMFGLTTNANWASLLLILLYGGIMATMFLAFIGMFSAVTKGDSPFTFAQVKRLRVISAMLLLYALIDYAITYNSTLLQLSTINSGYVSTNGSVIATINFAPLIAAGVVFAFSFVFKYGVLLQEFSDETI